MLNQEWQSRRRENETRSGANRGLAPTPPEPSAERVPMTPHLSALLDAVAESLRDAPPTATALCLRAKRLPDGRIAVTAFEEGEPSSRVSRES